MTRAEAKGAGGRSKPLRISQLPDGAWGRIAKRTYDGFQQHGLTNLAAALTYRSILALFPGLIALVAMLGVLGQYPQTYDSVLAIVGQIAPRSTVHAISGPLRNVVKSSGGAGALLSLGLVGAIWAASGYVGALLWATNTIWEAERGRSWYRQWPVNVAITLAGIVVLTLVLIALVVSGPVAQALGGQLGLGSTALGIWGVAKWPVILVLMTGLVGGLFYLAPNVRQPPPRWLTPGAALAVLTWVLATAGFGLYVANLGSYNATYGSLGAIVTFMVWVWVTNIAILLGVELDSEIERERELAAGIPASEEIQMPLRQE